MSLASYKGWVYVGNQISEKIISLEEFVVEDLDLAFELVDLDDLDEDEHQNHSTVWVEVSEKLASWGKVNNILALIFKL